MSWIKRYLSENDIQKIESAIAAAESKTSGEIVPVVVRRSSPIGHVAPMLTALFFVGLFFAKPAFLDMLFVTPWFYVWPVIAFLVFVMMVQISRFHIVQRIFTSNYDEAASVLERAELEFYRNKVHRTEMGTGILIFVSVMERRAVILADKGIADKLPQSHWDDVLKTFNSHLKKGEWAEAFVEAIQTCGKDLEPHCPIQPDDVNELKNHLVIKG